MKSKKKEMKRRKDTSRKVKDASEKEEDTSEEEDATKEEDIDFVQKELLDDLSVLLQVSQLLPTHTSIGNAEFQ